MLRLLTRRRCPSCGEELPPPREYPMRVCAPCILGAGRTPPADAERPSAVAWQGEGPAAGDCA